MVRVRNRYLAVRVTNPHHKYLEELSGPALHQLLHQQLQHHFGDSATAGANSTVQVALCHAVSGVCIIRCSRELHKQVLQLLPRCTQLAGRQVAVTLLKHTGSAAVCTVVAHQGAVQALQQLKLAPAAHTQASITLQAMLREVIV